MRARPGVRGVWLWLCLLSVAGCADTAGVNVYRLRLGAAAERLGVHPVTLRKWANAGVIPCIRVGDERRFTVADLDAFMGVGGAVQRPRVEALYVRVSGTAGQETSLDTQEQELRASALTSDIMVFRDRASGLRESRPGLTRLLAAAREGRVTVVRVTHEDRLARFGVAWLRELLARDNVTVEVLHPKGSAGGMDELLADFMSLVATFAGRMYGIRGREARQRLLTRAQHDVSSDGAT